jgi:hypothetical protein
MAADRNCACRPDELVRVGTQVMPAVGYGATLVMVEMGRSNPGSLVGRGLGLEEVGAALASMDSYGASINR